LFVIILAPEFLDRGGGRGVIDLSVQKLEKASLKFDWNSKRFRISNLIGGKIPLSLIAQTYSKK